MNFLSGIFGIFFRSLNWVASRIIVYMIQQAVILATVLLINKGTFKAKKTWAITKGTPNNLKALIQLKSQKRTADRRNKKLRKLRKRLQKQQESLEIITNGT